MKIGDETSLLWGLLEEHDVGAFVPYAMLTAAWLREPSFDELDLRVAISVLAHENAISAKYDDQRTVLGIVRI